MKTKKKSKFIKPLVFVLVLLITCIWLTSCSTDKTAVTSSATEATQQTPTNSVSTLSTTQKIEKFEEIIQNIQSSKTIDEAKPYFYGVDESNLANEIDYIKSFADYTNVMINVIAQTDTAFYVTRMDYSVSEEDGSARRSSNQSLYVVSQIDGQWKLDFSANNDSEIIQLANDKYYSQLNTDIQNYDNAITMNGVFNFFITSDEEDCFKNIVEGIILCTYQDNEGDVYVVVRLNNGNPAKSQTFHQYSIELTDDVLGTIVDTNIDANDTLPANSGKNITLKIPKEDVLTGTEKWNSVTSNLNVSYSD